MQKILIIDDDDSLRKGLHMFFKLKGYEALSAPDAETGLALAGSRLPDLIVCDIDMPGINGLEALTRLRANVTTAEIPLILMTGRLDISMRTGMDLGADDFLQKPVAIADILKTVEARLKKQQTVRQAADSRLSNLRASLRLRLPQELTSHLTEIINYSDILDNCRENIDPASLAEIAGHIRNNARSLHGSVRNFVLYVQLETIAADTDELNALRSLVTEQADQVIATAARTAARNARRDECLTLNLAPGRVEMSADLLAKIVEELVTNACKFSAPGMPVRVNLREAGNYQVIEVSDRGAGLSAEEIRALDAYVQFERGGQLKPGLGLGLAICRKLAVMHRGAIEFDSRPEAGTTISVKLPARVHQLRLEPKDRR